jgi:hypothetical protein
MGGMLVIERPIADGDVALLCARLRRLAGEDGGGGGREFTCDARVLAPDAVSVNALMRLQYTARRLGCSLRVMHASPELALLLAFCGLAEVARLGSGLETQWEPEELEQPLRVQERVDGDDLPV